MRYRRFVDLYRRGRQEAVPSPTLPIDSTTPARPHRTPIVWRVAALVAAATALIAGSSVFWPKNETLSSTDTPPPPVEQSTSPDSDKAPTPIQKQVQVTPALHGGTPLETISTANGAPTALSTLPFAYTDTTNEDHAPCSGVYYNVYNNTLFCCTHAIRELLEEKGIAGENVRVKCFASALGKLLFTLDDQPNHPSYVVDLLTDTILSVDADLYSTGTWMGGTDVSTVPYALLFAMDDTNTLYLIDLNTAEVRRLSDIYPAMEDATLSRGGQYVYYTVQNSHANTSARTTALYTIADGTFRTFTGEVVDGLADDSAFILRTPDGVRVYNTTVGEVQTPEEAAAPEAYLYGIRRTHAYTSFAWKLAVEDYRTGETRALDVGYVEASVRSHDRRSLYYYRRGESVIRVLDLLTGEETTAPLDPQLAQETEGEAVVGYNVAFTLTLSEARDPPTLLLQYVVTGTNRQDPETVQQEMERSASFQYHQWHENDPNGTIASMETLIQRFPDKLVAYEGDGYLYLDYTDLLELTVDGLGQRQCRYVLLEDYRTGYGYNLSHQWDSANAPFYGDGGYHLPSDAERDARRVLSAAGVRILPAEKDYGPYLTDGKLNALKIYLDSYRTDVLMEDVNCYFVYDKNDTEHAGDSRWGLELPEDMEELEQFLTMSDSLTYTKHMGNTAEYVAYERQCHYYLDLHQYASFRCRILVGRSDGRPYLVKGGCFAYLTEEQYRKTVDWLAKQYPKSFEEPQY